MNPWSGKPGRNFRQGRNSGSNRPAASSKQQHSSRRTNGAWLHKSLRRRELYGVAATKKTLTLSLLNVNGLNEASLADVRSTLTQRKPDLCIILETKRRDEDHGLNIEIEGYGVSEATRSDIAGDRNGGGIAIYTRVSDGLLFHDHDPDILDPDLAFARNEQVWKKVETPNGKTAICAVYLGFQAADDRHGSWNSKLLDLLQAEICVLRRQGFRTVLLGDFNCHVGNQSGVGVVGNHPDINRNGLRFFKFLKDTQCMHVNGSTDLTTGLWTRYGSGNSSVLDFAVVPLDHIGSVKSLFVDDTGSWGGNSDHNWLELVLSDSFVRLQRIHRNQVKKNRWNIASNQNWTGFKTAVDQSLSTLDTTVDVEALAKSVCKILYDAGLQHIGLKKFKGRSMRATALPRVLVEALVLKRRFETNWKTLLSSLSKVPPILRSAEITSSVSAAETLFLDQKRVVERLFMERRTSNKFKILDKCKGFSTDALKCFWSYVNSSVKTSSNIDAVISPEGGSLKCNPQDIRTEVEKHLVKVFKGSTEPFAKAEDTDEHAYSLSACKEDLLSVDHSYTVPPSSGLPPSDGSGSVKTDPLGWINKKFVYDEVVSAVSRLKNSKAVGTDNIPNFYKVLTVLYNKVKDGGKFPADWNRGRVCMVHKRGLREILGNYRPLTVINALSGLYSRILNSRLTQVVEEHLLLGQIQNGFRRGRMGSDNSFVLDSILWKSKISQKKVHLGFVDIQKAYDTVDRDILWKKLAGLGFGGDFLASLKSIYNDDSVVCEVNGLTTRPVYLRRGLRQGCSLSPLLFALYIAEMGKEITMSEEGFMVGRVCVSGLLFADDLVLIARSAAGLLRLLSLVRKHVEWLKMDINTERDKSEVISPEGVEGDAWQVQGGNGEVLLSLKQVIKYKYLGTYTFGSIYKTCAEKLKNCVSKAHKYKGSCIHISSDGPDVVSMVMATWCNVAIPAILHGCEMMPFTEETILEIERTQSQVAKFALGLPSSAASVCAQVDLGMKPFRQVLYESQLKFYIRVLRLPESFWVKQALLDHLSLRWKSPYLDYILKMRTKLGLYELPMMIPKLLRFTSTFFVSLTNTSLSGLSLPWLGQSERLVRQRYTCEGVASTTLAMFRYDAAGIGNKFPRPGTVTRQTFCPLCASVRRNTVAHLALFCPAIETIRSEQTSISSFRNICFLRGCSEDLIFSLLVNGMDSTKALLDRPDFLKRGLELKLLLDSWLARW